MGLVYCAKHGYEVIVEACCHVATMVRSTRWEAIREIQSVLLCEPCIEHFEFDRFDGVLDEIREYWEVYEQLDRSVVCEACASYSKLLASRRAGDPDPYTVYERTLTWRERDVVDELCALLSAALDWSEGQPRLDGQPGFGLVRGDHRSPMSLYTYSLDADARARINEIVRAFLDGRRLDQARIIHNESERWEVERLRGGTSTKRMPDVIIAQSYLNCGP